MFITFLSRDVAQGNGTTLRWAQVQLVTLVSTRPLKALPQLG